MDVSASTPDGRYHVGFDAGVPDGDMTAVVAAMHNMRVEIIATIRAVDGFTPAVRRASWAIIRWEYRMYGRTRPDGRPRRSGHRHRGTRAWARRHG